MIRRFVAAAATSVAALAVSAPALATTYYVSPSGDDGAAGAITAPWRTVARVNNAPLVAGDTVLFQGGATFSDAALMPSRSGAAGAPISFGSYGAGQATLTQGVWFASKSYLTFDGLTVDGTAGLQGSASGGGSTFIVVRNSRFVNAGVGINVSNVNDAYWTIAGNTIQHTRDSGIIALGHDIAYTGNTILDTGEDSSIPYGKHGVYAKGPAQTFVGNTIRRFSANGISLRYRNAVVHGNTISNGPIGIGWFQNDASAGTASIAYNTVTATSSSGIYVSPSDDAGATRESFVIANNTLQPAGGNGIDINATSGSLTVANNVFNGPYSIAFSIRRPAGAFSEHHNGFWRTDGTTYVALDGTWQTVEQYKAGGQGAGDLVADPLLDAALAPAVGSPLVDAGSASVAGASYNAGCDGAAFHYCGAAPEIGARETGAAAPPPPGGGGGSAPLVAPTGLAASSTTSAVTLTWDRSADTRVTGYTVSRDSVTTGTTSGTTYTVSGLACGSSGRFEVRGVTAAGPTPAASITASTAACPSPPDTTAPSLAIASPAANATVGLAFAVIVDASDPSGMRDVVVSVDGAVACTLVASPFSCTVRVGVGKHTISVRATDRAGNSATATRGVFAKKNVRSLASVSSLSPKSGSSVGRAFTLRAATTMDATRVTFAVDGTHRCTDARAPFTCKVSATPGMHRVVLRVASRGGSTTYRAVFRVR